MYRLTRRGSHAYSEPDWKTAVQAGVIAGIVFMVVEMLLTWLFLGESPWRPPRMIAAMILGRDALSPSPGLDLIPMMLMAVVIHLLLSGLYGAIIGWLVHRFDMTRAVLIGLVFGLVAIYFVNFHVIAPGLYPWFVQARSWVSLLSHAVFGMVAAGAYVKMQRARRA